MWTLAKPTYAHYWPDKYQNPQRRNSFSMVSYSEDLSRDCFNLEKIGQVTERNNQA